MHSLEPLKLRHETSLWSRSQGHFYSMFLFVFFEQKQGPLWSPTGGGHEVHESHGSRDGWRHCWTFPEEGIEGFGKLDESWMLLKLKPSFNCPLERRQIVGFSCQPVDKIARQCQVLAAGSAEMRRFAMETIAVIGKGVASHCSKAVAHHLRPLPGQGWFGGVEGKEENQWQPWKE